MPHPTIKIIGRQEQIQAALDFAQTLAAGLGFDAHEQKQIRLALEEIVEFLMRTALADTPGSTLSITFEEEADGLLIRIAQQGLPLDIEHLPVFSPARAADESQAEGLNLFLAEQVMDRVIFQNRGRDGCEILLLKRQAQLHIKARLEKEVTAPPAAAPAQPVDYTIRPAQPHEAVEISRCAYLTYGYTYEAYIYYPERIVELNQTGELRSLVAVSPTGTVMGHCALKFAQGRMDRAELGVLFVRPEYRGNNVGGALWQAAVELGRQLGLRSLFARSVTGHRASQKMAAHNGFHDCALFLSLFPREVNLKNLGGIQPGKMSGMWQWLKLAPARLRHIDPPLAWASIIRELYRRAEIPVEEGPPAAGASAPQLRDQRIPILNVALQEVVHIGPDPLAVVRWIISSVRRFCRCKLDAIYLALALEERDAAVVAGECMREGFVFSGIMPDAFADGDALVLQYLNSPENPFTQLTTWTETAKFLRDFIEQEWRAQEPTQGNE